MNSFMFSIYLLNAFFPPVCPVCSARVSTAGRLCSDCFSRLEFVSDNSEKRIAAVVYNETSKHLLMKLKYGDRPDLASLLAQLMYNAGNDLLRRADLLTCVPLHWKRMLFRKYNQAAVLSAELSKLSGVPSNPGLLKRIRATPKQGTRKERFENVKNAFAMNPNCDIQGKTIILIDDVLTTGATSRSCTEILMKNGAKAVCVLTFAKAGREDQTRP